MDEQKQIDELAIILSKVNPYPHENPFSVYGWKKFAAELIKYCQPKLPEGSMVLDHHEAQKYYTYKIIEPLIEFCLDREKALEEQLKDARKNTLIEASEKIKNKIKELRQRHHEDCINGLSDEEYNGITESDIDELLKDIGVE